jgi:TonB family protein
LSPSRLFTLPILALALGAGCTAPPERIRPNSFLAPHYLEGETNPDWDTPPKLVRGKSPVYPVSQFLGRDGGSALVEFTIDADGRTTDLVLLSATNKTFGDHTMIAIRQWRFEPAKKDGKPIAVRVQEGFTFDVK